MMQGQRNIKLTLLLLYISMQQTKNFCFYETCVTTELITFKQTER